MNKSVFEELKFKMLHSGSRLNLFMGINILVFIFIKLVTIFEWVSGSNSGVYKWLVNQLAMPADLSELLYKFWTPLTYMFSHENLFHIFFNLLWFYWMGRIFEDFLNKRQFTFTYLAGGFSGALLFILAYQVLPALANSPVSSSLIGASAGIMAIAVATATLVPDYAIMLIFIGEVRLKFLLFAYILLDIIQIAEQPGTSFAHLGGALLGFIYIKQLQNGNDWSKLFLKKKSKLKVVSKGPDKHANRVSNQEVIDKILDKISKSGYDSLTKTEKEQLFNASNDPKEK